MGNSQCKTSSKNKTKKIGIFNCFSTPQNDEPIEPRNTDRRQYSRSASSTIPYMKSALELSNLPQTSHTNSISSNDHTDITVIRNITPSYTNDKHTLTNQQNDDNLPLNSETYLDSKLFHTKYKIDTKLDDGNHGHGSVWKLNDNQCVKILPLGANNCIQACVNEYIATSKAFSNTELYIDDVSVVKEPKCYLVLPYFSGKKLCDCIGTLSTSIILDIFYKICVKLYDIHYNFNIIHGDITPQNIIIIEKNNQICDIQVVNYASAKLVNDNDDNDDLLLSCDSHFGSCGSIAPELMNNNEYNRKIDVFSLGVLLYNLVSGCDLFRMNNDNKCDFKYYLLTKHDYYKYLKEKFQCIQKEKEIIRLLYSCLAFDSAERMSVKQLKALWT